MKYALQNTFEHIGRNVYSSSLTIFQGGNSHKRNVSIPMGSKSQNIAINVPSRPINPTLKLVKPEKLLENN